MNSNTENILSCKFCNETFNTYDNLILHMKNCLKNIQIEIAFQCKYCLKNFTTKQNLDNHQKICVTAIINKKDKEIDHLRKQLYLYKPLPLFLQSKF